MSPADLDTFIKSPAFVIQMPLTKPGAVALRKAIRVLEQQAYERGVASVDPQVFDLTGHLSLPSRENPLAAAFAVNATKGCL